MSVLEVKFVGDEDVLEHIVDYKEGMDTIQRATKSTSWTPNVLMDLFIPLWIVVVFSRTCNRCSGPEDGDV